MAWEGKYVWWSQHNGVYYLSWGNEYATSENVYGPYTYVGRSGTGYKLGYLAHSSFFWWKGQFYHAWCYYLRNGYKWRSTNITYCHIADNGEVVTDTKFLDQHYSYGVARYDASWDKIEAEWFYEISDGVTKHGDLESGFYLRFNDSGVVRFKDVNFSDKVNAVTLMVECSNLCKITVRGGSDDGDILGDVKFKPTNNGGCEEVTIPIDINKGVEDIYIQFENKKNTNLKLDWIKFKL